MPARTPAIRNEGFPIRCNTLPLEQAHTHRDRKCSPQVFLNFWIEKSYPWKNNKQFTILFRYYTRAIYLYNYCTEFRLSRAISMHTMDLEDRATHLKIKCNGRSWSAVNEPTSAVLHAYNLPTLSANVAKLELKVSREKSCTFSQKLSKFHSIWKRDMSLIQICLLNNFLKIQGRIAIPWIMCYSATQIDHIWKRKYWDAGK